jgi:hypothetical protein
MKFFILITFILLSKMVLAESFLPENNLHLQFDKATGGISEAQFNAAIDKVEKVFGPGIKAQKKYLIVSRYYDSETVNAYATRIDPYWSVTFYGGMAKFKSMTPDGFLLVVCHEYGHHLGGSPTSSKSDLRWASVEGQADYWASTKCARRIWEKEDNHEAIKDLKVPPTLVSECHEGWSGAQDQDLCVRQGMAGLALTSVFAATDKVALPVFEKQSLAEVEKTFEGHPAAQCRLDTIVAGALCQKSYSEKVSATDETTGYCHEENDDTAGLRPRCWFKPREL